MEPDRDRIRVVRRGAADESDPAESRAWGCCVIGFISGCLVTATFVLALGRVWK